MNTDPEDFELIVLTLIKSRLERGEDIFVFTAGFMRGKLQSVEYLTAVPSSTYLGGNTYNPPAEPCLQITYIPGPRNPKPDAEQKKFTRKPQSFNMPARVASNSLFLQKVEERVWMLNVTTKVKE